MSFFLLSYEKTVRKYSNFSYNNHFTSVNSFSFSSALEVIVTITYTSAFVGFRIAITMPAIKVSGAMMLTTALSRLIPSYTGVPSAFVDSLKIGTEMHKKTSR